MLPSPLKDTMYLRLFGFLKIPMLFFLRPSVVKIDKNICQVKIPLGRRQKNHLGSMYFGVLAAGADCAGGLVAMQAIRDSGKKVSLSFKDFHADFLKRAEGDTIFTNNQGEEVRAFVKRVIESGERENFPVKITATCPKKLGDEPVAEFILTLSLKRKD
ncbi:MAG: DUF4442 domain-containing protein [Halobacteriovorax sp.]|nr:DUF4442 domain-containing protein [Halobacteriovorax sp.]